MGAPQGNEFKGLQHLVDTLKRVVMLDSYIDLVGVASLPTMASPVQLDLSSHVPAKATSVFISLFIRPSANAYWNVFTQTDLSVANNFHVQTLSGTINQFRTNYGIQPIASDKTFYYQSIRIAGGGNASWIVRLHGYIEPA